MLNKHFYYGVCVGHRRKALDAYGEAWKGETTFKGEERRCKRFMIQMRTE